MDVERLHALGPEAAYEAVQTLKGIGPFYAGLVVLRATGFADATLLVTEPKVLQRTGELYGLDGPPKLEQFREISDQWRPFRTWATVLIRLGGDRAARGPHGRIHRPASQSGDVTEAAPAHLSPVRRLLSVALIVLAGPVALSGGMVLYVREEVVDSQAFAARAVDIVQQPAVSHVVAREITVQVVEPALPDLIAGRPMIADGLTSSSAPTRSGQCSGSRPSTVTGCCSSAAATPCSTSPTRARW